MIIMIIIIIFIITLLQGVSLVLFGEALCSRYKNKHMAEHAASAGHYYI